MQTIYKYPINPGRTELWMPKDAQVLTVQMQGGNPYLWARVDTSLPREKRVFKVYGTGDEMPDDQCLLYVGTFQIEGGFFVLHLFDATYTY